MGDWAFLHIESKKAYHIFLPKVEEWMVERFLMKDDGHCIYWEEANIYFSLSTKKNATAGLVSYP